MLAITWVMIGKAGIALNVVLEVARQRVLAGAEGPTARMVGLSKEATNIGKRRRGRRPAIAGRHTSLVPTFCNHGQTS